MPVTRASSSLVSSRPVSLAALLLAFAGARVFYFTWGGLRFDATPLDFYFQFVDPKLLKEKLIESVTHLHSQPPLFNFLLGLVLKAFPVHYGIVLHGIYTLLGLALVLAMFYLMVRLGVRGWVAALVTALFACSPITALYENWLYLTYPIAALLAVSALLLHRYVSGGKFRDGLLFFATLAVIVLMRGYFNLVWYAVAAGAVFLAMPEARKRTAVAMAFPLPLLIGACMLTYVHFGTLTTGKIYRDFNLAMMSTPRLPRGIREKMIEEKKISGINRISIYAGLVEEQIAFVDAPKPTGIAVLDQTMKSTGHPNWHSKVFIKIAEVYGRDARYVISRYPGVYWREVLNHAGDYALPADQSDPFLNVANPAGSDMANRLAPMGPLVRGYDLITAGQWKHEGVAWFNVIGFPLLIAFALFVFARWFFWGNTPRCAGDQGAPAAAIVSMFVIYNFVYIAAVTIFFSTDDHSRYRYESTPLMCVLAAMVVGKAIDLLMGRGEDNRSKF